MVTADLYNIDYGDISHRKATMATACWDDGLSRFETGLGLGRVVQRAAV